MPIEPSSQTIKGYETFFRLENGLRLGVLVLLRLAYGDGWQGAAELVHPRADTGEPRRAAQAIKQARASMARYEFVVPQPRLDIECLTLLELGLLLREKRVWKLARSFFKTNDREIVFAAVDRLCAVRNQVMHSRSVTHSQLNDVLGVVELHFSAFLEFAESLCRVNDLPSAKAFIEFRDLYRQQFGDADSDAFIRTVMGDSRPDEWEARALREGAAFAAYGLRFERVEIRKALHAPLIRVELEVARLCTGYVGGMLDESGSQLANEFGGYVPMFSGFGLCIALRRAGVAVVLAGECVDVWSGRVVQVSGEAREAHWCATTRVVVWLDGSLSPSAVAEGLSRAFRLASTRTENGVVVPLPEVVCEFGYRGVCEGSNVDVYMVDQGWSTEDGTHAHAPEEWVGALRRGVFPFVF